MTVSVVIPARDEAQTIGGVVGAATSAGVGPVIVAADSCTDNTADIARAAGASVVEGGWGDKGTAMAAGLHYVETDDVLFLDGDLSGLDRRHVQGLSWLPPMSGQLVGLLDDTPLRTLAAHLPALSGERRLPTAVAGRAGLAGSGFQAETRLNAQVAKDGLRWRQILLRGVTNSPNIGHPVKLAMEGLTVSGGLIAFAPELFQYARHPEGRARTEG